MYNRNTKKPSIGRVVPGIPSLTDIDWLEGSSIFDLAANEAVELETKVHHSRQDKQHKYFIEQKELEYQTLNPESGSYEGNFSDEYPQPPYRPLPNIRDIKQFHGSKAYAEQFLVRYPIGSLVYKVLPELIKLVGTFSVSRNAEGLISGLQFCKDHFTTPERLGMLRLLTLNSKSAFLDKQYKGDSRYYCALVPVIMYAIRKAKGYKYSEWDPNEIHYITHSKLAEAMLCAEFTIPSKEELLEGRIKGLTFQTGPKLGTVRAAVSTHKLYSTNDTVYEGKPEYVSIMLSQIWCAHPENRHQYMILDPFNWDLVPEPLIVTEVLEGDVNKENKPRFSKVDAPSVPW